MGLEQLDGGAIPARLRAKKDKKENKYVSALVSSPLKEARAVGLEPKKSLVVKLAAPRW